MDKETKEKLEIIQKKYVQATRQLQQTTLSKTVFEQEYVRRNT
jgi:hypothetical protein